jgi:hypothetical protein
MTWYGYLTPTDTHVKTEPFNSIDVFNIIRMLLTVEYVFHGKISELVK